MLSNINLKRPAPRFAPDTSSHVPSGTVSSTSSKGFSIYSRNINFDEDYKSNYTFNNTKFIKEVPNTPLVNTFLDEHSRLTSSGNNALSSLSHKAASPLSYSASSMLYPVNDNNNESKHNNNNLNANNSPRVSSSQQQQLQPAKVYVDDLHNYSKPSFTASYTLTEVAHDDEEEEDDEEEAEDEDAAYSSGSEDIEPKQIAEVVQREHISEEKLTPDHHARRPMNAFLIFCKRHRAIVREKYPNLENR